jgi:Methionine synthase I, cobalamin-binding domain
MSDVIFIDDVRVVFDLEAVGRKLKLRSRSSAKMENLLTDMAAEAQSLARPRAAAKLSALALGEEEDQVRLGDSLFTSPLLREKLADLGRVFPYLATEGEELAQWGRAYEGLERILANALQNAAMGMARQRLEEAILEKYDLEQVSAMNPGSLLAWPITEQEPLFELLAPLPEELGITLLPTFMMKPEQTVSGLYFQTDTKFHNCQLCPRDDCPSRQAPYAAAGM